MHKFMKLLVIIAVGLSLSSCAHHDKDVEHHHHDASKKVSFNGKCASAVENSQYDIPGKPEFNVEYAGVIYYFSSEEKMNEFKKDIAKHAAAANRMWELRAQQIR